MAQFKPTFPEARLNAARLRPYFASALWRLIPVEVPDLGTMGVDSYGRCYYDPELFGVWTLDQCSTVIIHELLHRAMRHDKRGDRLAFPPEKAGDWNKAADIEINSMLEEDGFTLPKLPAPKNWDAKANGEWTGDPCTTKTVKAWQLVSDNTGGFKLEHKLVPPGLTAEEYYHLLQTEPPKDNKGNGPKPPPGKDDGEENDDQGAGDEGYPGGKTSTPPTGPGKEKDQANPLGGKDGSGATGKQAPWEQGPPTNEKPGMSDIESELASKEFAKAVQACGKGGAGLQRWAGSMLETPVVPWDVKLRAYLRDALERRVGTDDSTYAPPSRRSWGLWESGEDIMLQSGVSPIPEVFCVIDTSGSMGDDQLKAILAEIKGVCRAVNAPVKVACVDDEVYAVQSADENTIIRTKGGGGTDMRKGITFAEKQKPEPAVCIVLTDGYTPWPSEKCARMGIIAVIIPGGTNTAPDFINSINMENK